MAKRSGAESSSVVTPSDVDAWKGDPDGSPRVAAALRASGGRQSVDPVQELVRAVGIREEKVEALAAAEQSVALWVGRCRAAGATWAEVAGSLHLTAQAVQQRYGKTTR